MSKYAEQITAYEAKRGALVGSMDAIMSKAASEGATLDGAQQEEYDGFAADIIAVDDHLGRLRTMEAATATTMKTVVGTGSDAGTESRHSNIVVKQEPKLAPGVGMARVAKSIDLGKLNGMSPVDVAKGLNGERNPVTSAVIRAAVPAGTTLSGSWAEDLVGDATSVYADFVEFLRPITDLRKIGSGFVSTINDLAHSVRAFSCPVGTYNEFHLAR